MISICKGHLAELSSAAGFTIRKCINQYLSGLHLSIGKALYICMKLPHLQYNLCICHLLQLLAQSRSEQVLLHDRP